MTSVRTSMGSSWSLHTFLLLLLVLDHHHTGCSARIWKKTVEMVEVVEVVHSSYLSLVHRRQLQSGLYCIALSTADQTQLQAALDWACGPGKVDCSALQQGGSCFNPDTVSDHASYAFNQYYIAQSAAPNSCSFNGLAITTATKPQTSSTCNYPVFGGSPGTSPSTSNGTTTTSSPPPPSTTTSNSTFSPPSTGTVFDNSTTTGSTNFAILSPVPPAWSHALCSGILLILFSKL